MARSKEIEKAVAFRVYITDSLYYNAQNKYLNYRWIEEINKKPLETRSGDEIASDIISKAGLRLK